MNAFAIFDERPIVVAVAGPNGAGKTTFFHAHIAAAGLRYVNADVLARELTLESVEAMGMANALRRALVARRESFAFETVFSDPVQDKLNFLGETAALGYTVVLCYIGLDSAKLSEQRVAMRVAAGRLPHVLVFDNSDLNHPYRLLAIYENGQVVSRVEPLPQWLPLDI